MKLDELLCGSLVPAAFHPESPGFRNFQGCCSPLSATTLRSPVDLMTAAVLLPQKGDFRAEAFALGQTGVSVPFSRNAWRRRERLGLSPDGQAPVYRRPSRRTEPWILV